MVIKISKTSSVEGVVEYNTRKVEEGEAKILSSSLILAKSDAELTRDDIVAAFQNRISLNQRTKNTMTHISLNPDPKESLSDDLLTKVAEDFLEQLGYGEQPYIVVKHADIDREHVHVVVCNVGPDGKKIDDAYEKKRSNDIRKGLENKYSLLKAEEQRTERRYSVQMADAAKGNHFAQIRDIGGQLASEYVYGSVSDYRTLLEAHNISAQVIGDAEAGKAELLYGIGWDGFAAPPIAGRQFSDAGVGISYKDIVAQAERNAEQIKRHCATPGLKQVMQGLLSLDSMDELRKQCRRLKLELRFHQNEDGRVYGATIIDHKKKMVFKASALGREFSARHWQKFFDTSDAEVMEREKTNDNVELGKAAMETKENPVTEQAATMAAASDASGAGDGHGVVFEVGGSSHLVDMREEPTFDAIDDLISQGSLMDTSAWGGGGSGYKPDKKKRKKKKQNL